MRYGVYFEENRIGGVMTNHGMTDEEIIRAAGIELAQSEEEYQDAPENGLYIIDTLEIVQEEE